MTRSTVLSMAVRPSPAPEPKPMIIPGRSVAVRHGAGRARAGFWHAHMGWLFEQVSTNAERFAPDLLADRDLRVVDRLFPVWVAVSVGVPTVRGGLISWSWCGDRVLLGRAGAGVVPAPRDLVDQHHADPTCARHGVLPGQIDISARVVRVFERLGWVSDVRWTNSARLARLTTTDWTRHRDTPNEELTP